MAERHHWSSLDGVRGLAIAGVVAYHLGALPGGWLGVDVFFVLSGFLITRLLLDDRERTGRLRLVAFWGRRARRLLPAVLLLLGVLALYTWLGGTGVVGAQLRQPAFATLFYFANWSQIVTGHGYFAHYQAPDPLQHTWSLAIEEQYYLVWPLLLSALLVVHLRRRTRRRPRPASASALGAVPAMAALALASALWMGVAAHLFGPNRAYLGTDTRAWELLVGGIGGAVVPALGRLRHGALWSAAMVGGAGAVAAGVVFGGGPPGWMWDGGLVGVVVGAAVVVAGSVRHPDALSARLLAWAPLRWLGIVSYSLYLWHWPVIVIMTTATTGLTGASLLLARLAVMTAAACGSYVLVERPLRRADWSRWWRRALAPAAVGAVAAVVLAATVTPVQASTARIAEVASQSGDAGGLVLPPGRVPSAADPLRVWILGDSVMQDSAPGLTAALEATGDVKVVANSAFGGWGLTTDRGWYGQSTTIVDEDHPELVIGTWSWDAPAAHRHPVQYLEQLLAALGHLLAPGTGVDGVALLQFPQQGPNPEYLDAGKQTRAWVQQNDDQISWNDDARLAARFYRGHVLYLQTASLFSPDDRYFAWNRTSSGSWLRSRKIDNIHVCPYGAAELGALVARDLTPILHLGALAPGWQQGSWTRDATYDDPAGACPADQPPPRYDGVKVPGPPS